MDRTKSIVYLRILYSLVFWRSLAKNDVFMARNERKQHFAVGKQILEFLLKWALSQNSRIPVWSYHPVQKSDFPYCSRLGKISLQLIVFVNADTNEILLVRFYIVFEGLQDLFENSQDFFL